MRISIYLSHGNWIADVSEADNAAEIRALFGTTDIVTAFTSAMPASRVRDEIARLNPGHEIVIG
jgi:hypothetical protein